MHIHKWADLLRVPWGRYAGQQAAAAAAATVITAGSAGAGRATTADDVERQRTSPDWQGSPPPTTLDNSCPRCRWGILRPQTQEGFGRRSQTAVGRHRRMHGVRTPIRARTHTRTHTDSVPVSMFSIAVRGGIGIIIIRRCIGLTLFGLCWHWSCRSRITYRGYFLLPSGRTTTLLTW